MTETRLPASVVAPLFARGGRLVMVYDGDCVLCNGAVQWLMRRDRRAAIRFLAGGSARGQAVLAAGGLVDTVRDTVIVIAADGRVSVRTAAIRRLVGALDRPWCWLAPVLCPSGVTDWAYDRVARNRYRWFGRLPAGDGAACGLPDRSGRLAVRDPVPRVID